jgi:hypothetical protein
MKITLGDCSWGLDQFPNGVVMNFQDKASNIVVGIPFGSRSLPHLIRELATNGGLSEEEKRELAPLFTGGIFLPGQDFKQGPQG